MQTFLPYPSFSQTAQVLDYRRLGKQRVETKQILDCLTGKGSLRWVNHPAVKMWNGFEGWLAMYGYMTCQEWIARNYKDTLLPYFFNYMADSNFLHLDSPLPTFIGNESFHLSHRSNLLRKDSNYYRKYWPTDPDNLEYIWPTRNGV